MAEGPDSLFILVAHGLQEDDETMRRELPHSIWWLSIGSGRASGG